MKKLLLLLLTFNFLYSVEVSDFLCDCDFCKTVNKSEPIDIGYHILKCETWSGRRAKEDKKEAPESPPQEYLLIVEDSKIPTISEVKKLEEEKEKLNAKVKELQNRIKELEDFILELDSQKKDLPIEGWIYDSKHFKWVYLSDKIYPYLYSQDLGWMKYEPGSKPKQFYMYKQQKWKTY